MNALNLTASRRRNQVVILSCLTLDSKSKNNFRKRLSRTLSSMGSWVRCNCTPRNIVSALFSAKASVAVTILCACAIWWHNISIPDVAAAQRAVAIDGLCAMPWGIAWLIKTVRQPMKEEGGEL